MQKAEQAIDKMLNTGLGLLQKQNDIEPSEELNSPVSPDEKTKNVVEEQTVVLPDGSKAKLNIIGDLP
jgi:hypothetical protein